MESGISAKSIGADYLSWVKDCAKKLHLKGAVFTKDDGSIKIIAEGEDEDLRELTEKLEVNNLLFTVENFYVKWEDAKEEFKDFTIGYQKVYT